jgi:hypothetical protein
LQLYASIGGIMFRLCVLFVSMICIQCAADPKPHSDVPITSQITAEDSEAACGNGLDDDQDGGVDCNDVGCWQTTHCQIPPSEGGTTLEPGDGGGTIPPNGGTSNDPVPTLENTNALCSDGIDNDGDSYGDCADLHCKESCDITACGIENTPEFCTDGIDNDNNGKIDCDDPGCRKCLAACANGIPSGGATGGGGSGTTPPAPTVVHIRDMQDASLPTSISVAPNQSIAVELNDLTVTSPLLKSAGKNLFYVQEIFAPDDPRYAGIEVYAGTQSPTIAVGDIIHLKAKYQEYFGLSQLSFVSLQKTGTSATVPAATRVPIDTLLDLTDAEAYEGVLISVNDLQVVATSNASDANFSKAPYISVASTGSTDTTQTLRISTKYVPSRLQVGDTLTSVTGALTFVWEHYQLVPRTADDIAR